MTTTDATRRATTGIIPFHAILPLRIIVLLGELRSVNCVGGRQHFGSHHVNVISQGDES